jgi:hypothetical protein
MLDIEVGVEYTFDAPLGATGVTVTHSWGDTVPATLSSFTPDSIDVYKIVWSTGETEFVSGYVPLCDKVGVLDRYPELDDISDTEFLSIERTIRHIIQNYCGQKFGPYMDKSLVVQGDGGDSLVMPVRVSSLTSVHTSYGDDVTEFIEVSPGINSILQKKPPYRNVSIHDTKKDVTYRKFELFTVEQNFTVRGNFGWEYVPSEVEDAAMMLIYEIAGDDEITQLRAKGINEIQLGDFKAKINADQWGTTGSAAVDNILASFVDFNVGLV